MTRRQEIENIIIGTLLSTDDNYFASCRCCITQDMFSDEVNRRIYGMVSEINLSGQTETDPHSIFIRYGDNVSDLIPRMCELAADYSFLSRKTFYNERQYLIYAGHGIRPNYTDVTFDDYVNRFIQIVFADEGNTDNRRGEGTAA